MKSRELKGKGNFYRRVKSVITGEASSTVSTFSTGFRPEFLFAYFVWMASCTTQRRAICNISQYVNKSDSSTKKESSWESPGRENRRQILFSLPCFTHFSLCSLWMNIRTSLNHRKFIFPVLWNYLSREFRIFSTRDIAGNRCRVPLVGGVTAMTGENWEFL